MSQETPLQFGLRVARTWYSGGHGDLAHLIAREVERREAAPAPTNKEEPHESQETHRTAR